jgi:hypothetical protein
MLRRPKRSKNEVVAPKEEEDFIFGHGDVNRHFSELLNKLNTF